MKQCPHCGHKLSLGAFALLYGSDTLVKHSPQAHPREHFCLSCHRRVWIHHNYFKFVRLVRIWAGVIGVLALLATVIFSSTVMPLDPLQAVLFGIVLAALQIPLGLLFAKYQSAELKEEKHSPDSHG